VGGIAYRWGGGPLLFYGPNLHPGLPRTLGPTILWGRGGWPNSKLPPTPSLLESKRKVQSALFGRKPGYGKLELFQYPPTHPRFNQQEGSINRQQLFS